jgi:hypothetical protein
MKPGMNQPGERVSSMTPRSGGFISLDSFVLGFFCGFLLLTAGARVAQAQDAVRLPSSPTTQVAPATLDSLCATRSINLTVGQLFGGIRDAMREALRRSPAPPLAPADSVWRSLRVTVAWLAVMIFLGIGALVFSGDHLRRVVEAMEQMPARTVWTGAAAELAIVPVMVGVSIALAITLIGALLIPFAIVLLMFVLLGMVTLGYLAVAQVIGRALVRKATENLSERGAALRSLLVGLSVLGIPWIVVALLLFTPVAGTVARVIASTITYLAMTAGLGAVVLSHWRSFLMRREARVTVPVEDPISWRTPTPVGGVAAVKRPGV